MSVTGRSVRLMQVAVVLCAVAGSRPAHGDVFVLAQGGQVSGELQNPNQVPRETYVVKSTGGVTVTLARSDVKQWQRTKPEVVEFEKIRLSYADTAEAQWKLANWCKEHKLATQRKAILEHILELDPNHQQAHLALGHYRVDGEWMTQLDWAAKQGLQWSQGRFRTKQEIEALKEKHDLSVVQKKWIEAVRRLVSALGTDRGDAAHAAILAIKDPAAVDGLAMGLIGKKSHGNPQVRTLLAAALANLGTDVAMQALAVAAIDDDVEDVRLNCLDLLKKKVSPGIVGYFVKRLRTAKENSVIRRAGVALKAMGDKSAVGPLIDALVTTHKIKLPTAPGQTSAGFGKGGGGSGIGGASGGGFSTGGGSAYITQVSQNREVLDALVAITGQSGFEYDAHAWRTWLTAQKQQQQHDIDMRRGE